MHWLLILAASVLAIGHLISIAVLLRSAGNYDEHMPDLDGVA